MAGCGSEKACSPPSGVMWVSFCRYVVSFVFVFGFVVCVVATPCICGRVGACYLVKTALVNRT
ncbi:hypothetical protein HMPREF1861_01538 [Corynebacterium kroppenstedtii]|nr:hypothetical protein HMPREF1861_01538 [Corynebacterium kroppenstedtii]